MTEHYNKHYVTLREDGAIVDGFSDAFRAPQAGDLLINGQGGYQFRLFPGGEENPALRDELGVPLYACADGRVTARSDGELRAEREALSAERARQGRIEELKERLAATDYAVVKIAEGAAEAGEYANLIERRRAWRRAINALDGGDA